jgi:hypothetical protein
MSAATSGLSPHIAEPVIGRAFARPVGSCGLLAQPRSETHRVYAPQLMGIASLHPSYALASQVAGDAKLILQGTVTTASYCSDDRRIIWRPSFIALRLLT